MGSVLFCEKNERQRNEEEGDGRRGNKGSRRSCGLAQVTACRVSKWSPGCIPSPLTTSPAPYNFCLLVRNSLQMQSSDMTLDQLQNCWEFIWSINMTSTIFAKTKHVSAKEEGAY